MEEAWLGGKVLGWSHEVSLGLGQAPLSPGRCALGGCRALSAFMAQGPESLQQGWV